MKRLQLRHIASAILVLASSSLFSSQSKAQGLAKPSKVEIWKVTLPGEFTSSIFSKTKWGPNVETFCGIENGGSGYSVHCLGLHLDDSLISKGTVNIDGSRIRLIWGPLFNRMGITGRLNTATKFDGTFFVEHFGISSDAPEKSTGERLYLSQGTSDNGGMASLLARLFQKMAQGAPTGPFAGDAPDMRLPTDDQLRPLGKVETIRYLGERTSGKGTAANIHSVYDVLFADEDMICELHQNAEKAIDYFDCG